MNRLVAIASPSSAVATGVASTNSLRPGPTACATASRSEHGGARRIGAALQLPPVHGHEAGTKAFDAGKVLVARRLVDRALAAELGLERRHRDAVRLHAAIAAALAHRLVDDHALGRVD